MSDQAPANVTEDNSAPAHTETPVKPATTEEAPAAPAPSEGPTGETTPVKVEQSTHDKPSDTTATNSENKESEEQATDSNKGDQGSKDEPPAESNKAADESVEVKMETSTNEEKPASEEKIADVTTNASSADSTAPPTQQSPPQPSITQQRPQQATENKEPAAPKQPVLTTKQYLDATVVPILHSALSQLAKVRPEDPITFLANFLIDYKNEFKTN